MLPAHLLDDHPATIRIRPLSTGNCLYGYVGEKQGRVDFCVCFTCKKGFVGDGSNSKHAQWITIHSKSDECRAVHRQQLAAFKDLSAHEQPETPSARTDIMTVWEECRTDKHCRLAIEEVETLFKEMDDEFEPAEGIKQLARNVMSYKKEVKRVAAQVTQLTQEHDREMTEQRVVLAQHQQDIRHLHSSVRQLNYEQSEMAREMAAMKARIALLEKQAAEVVPKCSEQIATPSQG